jgi:hypothetical protein
MTSNLITITDAPYNAVCDGVTDDSAAILHAVADLSIGGKLIIPGPTATSQTIVIGKPVTIAGFGMGISSIGAIGDVEVLRFMGTCDNGGFRDLGIYGMPALSATKNVVIIETNATVHLKDSRIWGGFSAMYDRGSDGIRENLFLSGASASGACVASNGQNWWVRCKFDKSAWPQQWAFLQGVSPANVPSSENTFTQCDFSGDYQFSVQVDDGGAQKANVVFDGGCVFSSPVLISNALWAAFDGCRFGSSITAGINVPITVANSLALSPTVVTGGIRHISNNHNIS